MKKLYIKIQVVILFIIGLSINNKAATFTVTNTGGNGYSCTPNGTNTNVCLATGTLGWAISSANLNPGADIIDFNLPLNSVIVVDNPNWLLITDGNLTINATIGAMNTLWVGAGSCRPIIQITCAFSNGFDINNVPNVTIRGLVLNMQGFAITYRGIGVTSGTVQGCYGALNFAGTAATPNIPQSSVQIINGANGVLVGGNSCELRNVFLGNNNGGVSLENGDNNIIRGNYFNTNAAGTAHISPGSPQAAIRLQTGSTGNLIEDNVVTLNTGQGAIYIQSGSNNAIIRNNLIGFAVGGVNTIPNAFPTQHGTTHGILVDASTNGIIDNCTIGNFSENGIHFQGTGSNGWTMTGNKIGTDISGTLDRGNRGRGIFSTAVVSNHTIGGAAVAQRNIVSGNGPVQGDGIMYAAGCNTCVIQNNYIGVDATGNNCLPNTSSGIFIEGACTNVTVTDNIVGCNGFPGNGGRHHGIHFFGNSNHLITNNRIGIGLNGTANLGNNQDGIAFNTVSNTSINNNIIANNQWGIFMQGAGGSNTITANNIFRNGDTPVPTGFGFTRLTNNEGGGIAAQTGSNGNFIGLALAGQGNTLDNNLCGIHLRGDPGGTSGNIVYNNTITNSRIGNYSKYSFAVAGSGITISGGSNLQKIGGIGPLQANNINNNAGIGVLVENSTNVEIRRNSVFCNGSNAAQKSTPTFAIRLINGGNGAITPPGPITYIGGVGITNGGGIPSSITPDNITAGDVVEVFFDDACGCQLETWLGNATTSGTDWSYPSGGAPTPIPTGVNGGYCVDGSTLPGGGLCDPGNVVTSGAPNNFLLTSVTATRTSNPSLTSAMSSTTARTSEPMTCTPTVLPVTLLSFKATKSSPSSATITWSTSSEKMNKHFELLRSVDGYTYVSAGIIPGNGTTERIITYEFEDIVIDAPIIYYMLMQHDEDGSNQIIALTTLNFDSQSQIQVFSTTDQQIRVFNKTGTPFTKIQISDTSGKLIYEFTDFNNDFEYLIPMNTLPPSMYLVHVSTEWMNTTGKVIIK